MCIRDRVSVLSDFNIDFLKNERTVIEFKIFIFDFKQIIEKPTHINGGLIDHIYVRKSLFDVFEIDFIKYSLSFSDHDALKIRLKLKVNE